MVKKWHKILYEATICSLLLAVGMLNGHQGYLDRNKIEYNTILGLPVYEEDRYMDKKTENEILRIFQEEGVHLQQAIFIALYSGVDLNKVLDGDLTFEQYSSIIQIITQSISYHIDKYSEFETKDDMAKEYHTNLLDALKKFHNSLVYYYSAVVERDGKLDLEQVYYENGIAGINNYFDYIGTMESYLTMIEETNPEGYKLYIENVEEGVQTVQDDLNAMVN